MAVIVADVRVVIETDLTDPEVQAFLDGAFVLVDEDLAESTYSAARKDQIHIWLTAHMIAMARQHDARILSEEAENVVSATYGGKFDLHLNHTRYGQHVAALDKDGFLTDDPVVSRRLPALIQVV